MNLALAVLASEGNKGMLENLSPLQLFFASLGLMAVAGVMYLINKRLFKGDSLLLGLSAFLCGLAGVVGLFKSLFGG